MTDPAWRADVTATAARGRLPGAGWILGTSLWLVPVLFFAGNGAWLGFLIIGSMLLRTTWLFAAGVYAIWAIVAATLPDEGARIVASGALQFVSIIHGMVANRRLLITIWGRIERGEQWWGRGVTPRPARPGRQPADRQPSRRTRRRAAEVPQEAEALLAASGTDRSDYLADPTPAPLPPPRGRRRGGSPPPPTAQPAAPATEEPATTVDVNTATEDDFKTLPGFSGKKARAAVDARARRGRFASVQEFADDLGLQPHQLVQLRDRLTCSHPRRKSFGRRVDL
jgi:DNA uptake protein ComE-like DNA-binding protein